MECKICGKTSDEIELFDGIFEEKIESVCSICARIEDTPLIKKPNPERFIEHKENLSVRQRMERMADPLKPIQKEHFIAHKNLAKLNFPTKREDHPDLIENYDWILKTARRRKKLSQTQLAEELIIPLQVIIDLESGRITKDFMSYTERLENFLHVCIRKLVPERFNLQRKPETEYEERMVLDKVKKNMEPESMKREPKGVNFSDRERLKTWTLKDLVNLKRKKEQNELFKVEKSKMVGNELDFEE